MALLGNYSVILKNPATFIGGTQVSNCRSAFGSEGQMLQMYYGESEGGGLPLTASLDTGTEPPYSWHLAEKGGELSSTTMINGTATLTASQQNGINIVSTLAGVGTIDTAGLALVTSMIATIAGTGALTGAMVGTVQLAADLAGSGDVTGALGMLSGMVADLAGAGAISSDLKGKLFMEAQIYINEGQATVDQIVEGVTDSLGSITATVPNLLNTETGDVIIPLD
jgi:ABC-type transporter Mla MlaB component